MPSRPSRLLRRRAELGPPARLRRRGLLALGLLGLGLGCASGGGQPPPAPAVPPLPNLTSQHRAFLLPPLEGYPLVVGGEVELRLSSGWRQLMEAEDAGAAQAVADELLVFDPGLHPAQVLAAQVAFARGHVGAVLERLRPVLDELPGYSAAALLVARGEELVGSAAEAFALYRSLEGRYPSAAERARELEPRALEVVSRRLDDALARNRLDEAQQALERLEAWSPDSETTLAAAAAFARSSRNPEAELAALRRLGALRPDDRRLLERRGDLELDIGDAATGLEIFQRLVELYPDDRLLEERLGDAKVRWRLTLMPSRVHQVARRAELERGDWPVLVYWLFPSVRYASVDRPRIATDILDDPRREEIARVINLDLMAYDETLHRFAPEEPLARWAALGSLLRVLAAAPQPVACVQDLGPSPTVEAVCYTAARCGLLAQTADCLPGATLSGREAVGLLRRSLELVESR